MGDNLYLNRERFNDFLQDINLLKLRKMSHDQVRLMFETLLYGGLRIGEVLQITPTLLIGNNRIKIPKSKGGTKRCACSKWEFRPTRLISSNKDCPKCLGVGKYRIPVEVWVDKTTYIKLIELAKIKKPDERLFPITRAWAWHYANELLKGRTHTFRHTFLTWMLETEKFNIRDIMQKARHKSLAVTTKYIESNTHVTQSKEDKFIKRV